jgi:peptidoglycan/LPS O-acetylase OafA/YrhL
MNNNPLHPALRLAVSGFLSVLVLYLSPGAERDPRWLIGLAGVAAAAFVLLIPVMVRGESWQKMLAGRLLFVPCLGLLVAVMGAVSSR